MGLGYFLSSGPIIPAFSASCPGAKSLAQPWQNIGIFASCPGANALAFCPPVSEFCASLPGERIEAPHPPQVGGEIANASLIFNDIAVVAVAANNSTAKIPKVKNVLIQNV